MPEGLSITWIITSRVGLLTSIVVKWNTLGCQSEDEGISKHVFVVKLVQESSVVVVVNEKTKSIKVLEMSLLLLVSL